MITTATILAARGDADTLLAYALQLLGALDEARHAKPATKRVTSRAPMETWMTPFMEAWEKELGEGTFPFSVAAKPLKKLVDKGHPPAEIARNLGYYLRDAQRRNAVQFASIAKFAQTFHDWNPDDPAFSESD